MGLREEAEGRCHGDFRASDPHSPHVRDTPGVSNLHPVCSSETSGAPAGRAAPRVPNSKGETKRPQSRRCGTCLSLRQRGGALGWGPHLPQSQLIEAAPAQHPVGTCKRSEERRQVSKAMAGKHFPPEERKTMANDCEGKRSDNCFYEAKTQQSYKSRRKVSL